MKWTWTIRELLFAMLLYAMISAVYWNQQHGYKHFGLWLTAIMGLLGMPVMLHHFARRRQTIVLIAGLVSACIGLGSAWLLLDAWIG